MISVRKSSERSPPGRRKLFAQRGIPVSGSILAESVHAQITAASGGNVRIEILAVQIGEAVCAGSLAGIGT